MPQPTCLSFQGPYPSSHRGPYTFEPYPFEPDPFEPYPFEPASSQPMTTSEPDQAAGSLSDRERKLHTLPLPYPRPTLALPSLPELPPSPSLSSLFSLLSSNVINHFFSLLSLSVAVTENVAAVPRLEASQGVRRRARGPRLSRVRPAPPSPAQLSSMLISSASRCLCALCRSLSRQQLVDDDMPVIVATLVECPHINEL